MAISATELRGALEAILFVSGEPVKTTDLVEAFPDEGEEGIVAQLDAIRAALDEQQSGFQLELAAGGWRFATRPEYDPFLRKFFSRQGEGRLSVAALETLAIIAYRQPVTGPEISDIRGVNSSGVLRTLQERKLIKIAGRKNVVGSPFLYRTTREFLVHFGLNAVQDLPRLEEFAEILGENLSEELIEAIGGEHPQESTRQIEADGAESAGPADDPVQPEVEGAEAEPGPGSFMEDGDAGEPDDASTLPEQTESTESPGSADTDGESGDTEASGDAGDILTEAIAEERD